MTDIHSCSYYCTRPACVLQQRNELRDEMLARLESKIDTHQKQAEPVVMQYIALCDAMRYSERKDELTSPEEHAESLVAEIERLKQAEPVVPMDAEIVHFAKTALHEMPRPATDWHHCAKRVCEAVVAAQQAEPVEPAKGESNGMA